MSENIIVDVVADISNIDTTNALSTLRELCRTTREIKHSISSTLGKTDFSDITKRNSKLTKNILLQTYYQLLN